jgi:hypothetical protein
MVVSALAKGQVSVDARATPTLQQRPSTETPLRLLHAGFDALDIVFKGSLSDEAIATLEIAHGIALDRNEAVLSALGPGKEPVHVHQNGLPGGYRFRCTTGSLGEIWGFTDTRPQGWNAICSVRAATLAAYGWQETVQRAFARLKSFGCRTTDHRVARVDYAIDFLMPSAFELGLYQFVAHAHSKLKPYWGKREAGEAATRPTAVCRGRRLESVTIGKMPGRQVCVYDKRREAVEQGKPLWFRLWGIDPAAAANVWRVELRAGKKELRRWPIRTLSEVEASIADVLLSMAGQVETSKNRVFWAARGLVRG